MTAGAKLEKAYLKVTPSTAGGLSATELHCRFNPTKYSVEASSEYKSTVGKGYTSAPKIEFVGARARKLKMELFFDGRESGTTDVSEDVDTLMSWLKPTPSSTTSKKPAPPVIVFHWGKKASFEAHLTSANATFEMFDRDGTPVRARVTVEFEEGQFEPPKQNPSSGALAAFATHRVVIGETLQSIAHREYDDATLWRGLADFNGVDDPMRLSTGIELLIPPVEEARARS